MIMFSFKDIMMNPNQSSSFNFLNICRYIILMIPHFSFLLCIAGFLEITWENNKCEVCNSPTMAKECRKYIFYAFLF